VESKPPITAQEAAMDAKLVAEAESLYRAAVRLERIGLIVDRAALSPERRRAAFALQCLTAACPGPDPSEKKHSQIGFAYPSSR
jgi:hypothetical protein